MLCRMTNSASGSRSVTMLTSTGSPFESGSGADRSRIAPFTRTTTAAFASPRPIDWARSRPVAPAGNSRTLPSGSLTLGIARLALSSLSTARRPATEREPPGPTSGPGGGS